MIMAPTSLAFWLVGDSFDFIGCLAPKREINYVDVDVQKNFRKVCFLSTYFNTFFLFIYIYIGEKITEELCMQLHMQIGKRLFVKEIFYDAFIYFRLHGDVPRSCFERQLLGGGGGGERRCISTMCHNLKNNNNKIMPLNIYFTSSLIQRNPSCPICWFLKVS